MFTDTLSVLDTLSHIYEDLDIDSVEEKLVELVDEAFSFDRIALFFVKHRKHVLQGKLAKGFPAQLIEDFTIPLESDSAFITPLITGIPYWGNEHETGNPVADALGLKNYVLIPIINRKRISCWEEKSCANTDCPAHGKKLLRCWLVSGTKCCEGTISQEEKMARCEKCPIFSNQNIEAMEGVILADNSLSDELIRREVVTALSIIAHTVGRAINNSKLYTKTLNDSIRDVLTGLHNRRFFNERVLDEIDRSRRYNEAISLVLCDIDHFKKVNDTHGHPMGDAVLAWLANILREKRRKSDVVARYGGEEFAILLLSTEKSEAVEIAEKLRRTIEDATFRHLNVELPITLSFGVATFPNDTSSSEGLMRLADRALYVAKAQGRNRVCAAA